MLDSDQNEHNHITHRSLVALASDVLGRATVSQTTPNAFEITAANNTLLIGTGRYYVDGLLAENHGTPDPDRRRFDSLLGEPAFEDPIDYAAQPYLPDPTALPDRGTYIVYLEVWQREVTPAQEPDLVESAVGVETSSRIQTVWQVRVLSTPSDPSLTCGSEPEEWFALVAPSTGVLSTGTFDVPDVNDPCELPPSGGYRGLENQLYRVEIHDPGLPGQGATFKFSRENASVEVAVDLVVHAKELELKSLGRDNVLGFNVGDWIELTNEAREFARRPGEIRRITGIDPDSARIALSEDLPSDLAPVGATTPTKGLLARRWDQKNPIRRIGPSDTLLPFHDLDAPSVTPGVIPVPPPNTTLLLEDGVTVTFDTTGSTGFKHGDYWVFAARTANASIERLDRAPPLGVCHHFARLAVWDADTGRVTDCRVPWPPTGAEVQPVHDCSCTVCVTPDSHHSGKLTIQAAVEKVKRSGGTVCLATGRYRLEGPIEIHGAQSVRIRGVNRGRLATPQGTVLEGNNQVFSITASEAIEIQDLLLVSPNVAVSIKSSGNVVLERLAIDAEGQAIQLEGQLPNLCIRQNEIRAKVGMRGEGVSHRDDPSLAEPRHESSLSFEDNWILYQSEGLRLLKVLASGHTRVVRNKLQGAGTAIEVRNADEDPNASTTISENYVEVSGEQAIVSNAKTLSMTDNHVTITGQGGPGIVVLEADDCRFEDNRIEVKGPLLAVQIQANVAFVNANRVKNSRSAIAIDASSSNHATVLGNVTTGPIKVPANRTPNDWEPFNSRLL